MSIKDKNLQFPHFTLLKASAGSGKTYALTKRYVQFLLSEKISGNCLKNVCAVTFSNNAANEMKEKILAWLKGVCLGDRDRISALLEVVSIDLYEIKDKSARVIDNIIKNYSDFQVKTIDSFITAIFTSVALDIGFNPNFEIVLNPDNLMQYAFHLFLRNVREGTEESKLLNKIILMICENRKRDAAFLWDPSKTLFNEIKGLSKKLATIGKNAAIEDFSREIHKVKAEIRTDVDMLELIIEKSSLKRSKGSSFPAILQSVRDNSFIDLIGRGLSNCPVKKPSKNDDKQENYKQIQYRWLELGEKIREYITCYARTYYTPYVSVYEEFRETVESVKRQQGKVFIDDMNKHLAAYMNQNIVPDIYFRIGETIVHYLIDEFQDTSPIQWVNLYPLIENSLSQCGSLFVVGDTKQAIYGFREADYQIMKKAESVNPFPSAIHQIDELEENFRSLKKIIDFNKKVFTCVVAEDKTYRMAAIQSGLLEYDQKPGRSDKNQGYVEIEIFKKDEEMLPEKGKIQKLVAELYQRGYKYSDICILTPKNSVVVKVTSWLNEKDIPFISYSSLDIRKRTISGEAISLLNFLDSPIDDLAFMTFILGDIFSETIKKADLPIKIKDLHEFFFFNRDNVPVYKEFQNTFPEIWTKYFERLFTSVGYLPIYDIVTEIFMLFRVWEILPGEEAAFAKILDVIKEFEENGNNNLADFLDFAARVEGNEKEWDINVPVDVDAVKVMTVHKSKGLGFPVVINIQYSEQNKGFPYILDDYQKDSVYLLKINKEIATANPLFLEFYERERLKQHVSRLNTLYVGFTRAMAELYIVGIKGKRDSYPFSLLPDEEYKPSSKPSAVFRAPDVKTESIFPYYHYRSVKLPHDFKGTLNIDERRRGEFIHRVFSFLEYIDYGIEEAINKIVIKVSGETGYLSDRKTIVDIVLNLLRLEEVGVYFVHKEGRVVKNEQEFCDACGYQFRMDRVVIDNDRVTVIDYKTGSNNDENKYREQMERYVNLLKDIFPKKTIDGVIAHVDMCCSYNIITWNEPE